MIKNVPITQDFGQDIGHQAGNATLVMDGAAGWAWELFIKGQLAIVPAFVKRPDGTLEITELSLVPTDQVMPRELREKFIATAPVTPEVQP